MIVTEQKSGFLWKALINAVFIALSACCVIPLLLILSSSFTTEQNLATQGYAFIPKVFSLQAYRFIFQNPTQLFQSYGVTVFVTATGTFCGLLITSALAYVVSRKDFKLQRIYSFMVLFTLLFSGGMVPSYIIISRYYHLKDTIFVLILPYLLNSWYVFLMKGFFLDLPISLIEAAKIDGAKEVSIFFRIVIPISKPALATIGLFIAFQYWNDWWLSMLYIDRAALTSLQFYLYRIMSNIQFLAQATQNVNVSINIADMPGETARMALCVLAAGPMLVIFPFFQKYFVRGITMGAVKG